MPSPAVQEGGSPAKGLAAFPVSSYPPLELQRPLEVFGASFLVHIATPFTLNPDTLTRVLTDTSLQTAIRTNVKAEIRGFHPLLKKLSYVARGKHKLSAGLRNLSIRELGPLLPAWEIEQALDGRGPPVLPRSTWATLLQGMQGTAGDLKREVATCLAACDSHYIYLDALIGGGRQGEGQAHLDKLLGASQEAWQSLNPRLAFKVMLLVEVALKALAWVESRFAALEQGQTAMATQSPVDSMLAPGRRPLGHWLKEVCDASGCAHLTHLSTRLDLKYGAQGDAPSRHLLKQWSSSRVMPAARLKQVLGAVRIREQAQVIENRFYVARLLTFLCDLTWAGTIDTPPSWEVVQAHIRSRHAEAYRLEVQRLQAASA
jgi:hypothetical protein